MYYTIRATIFPKKKKIKNNIERPYPPGTAPLTSNSHLTVHNKKNRATKKPITSSKKGKPNGHAYGQSQTC